MNPVLVPMQADDALCAPSEPRADSCRRNTTTAHCLLTGRDRYSLHSPRLEEDAASGYQGMSVQFQSRPISQFRVCMRPLCMTTS
jgi:hypothetical protein